MAFKNIQIFLQESETIFYEIKVRVGSRKICIKSLSLVLKSVILTEIYGKSFSYQGKYSCTKLSWYFEHFEAC